MTARFLYLHGFASGPESTKGRAVAEALGRRGVHVDRMNLRVPSFERLRVSEMIRQVQDAIGGPEDQAVFLGSSLGGLVAARVAASDARVGAVVLLAPALGLARRWRERSVAEIADWEESGWLAVTDHTTGRLGRVDLGFLHDLEAVDRGEPDVRVPTLVIHGTADEVVDIEGSRRWAEGRSNVRLLEVDDDHELRASIPRICAEVDRFLSPWWAGGVELDR